MRFSQRILTETTAIIQEMDRFVNILASTIPSKIIFHLIFSGKTGLQCSAARQSIDKSLPAIRSIQGVAPER